MGNITRNRAERLTESDGTTNPVGSTSNFSFIKERGVFVPQLSIPPITKFSRGVRELLFAHPDQKKSSTVKGNLVEISLLRPDKNVEFYHVGSGVSYIA